MITALLIVAAIALLLEVAGVLYCVIRNIPFGRRFGAIIFFQISLPAVFFAIALVWEHFSPTTGGVDSFGGTGFDRGFRLYFSFLATAFATTLAAGLLGFSRIFFRRHDTRFPTRA